VPAERAHLFEAYNGGATEVEYLELLYAFVRATKPEHVLETGCFDGRGTLWLAHALSCNGFGLLHSIDNNHQMLDRAAQRINDAGYTQQVKLHHGDTFDVIRTFDFTFGVAFFDSHLPIRAEEAGLCLDRALVDKGSILAFHDTSRLRTTGGGEDSRDPDTAKFWESFDRRVLPRVRGVFELPLSRGLVLARV
jgi:predicted O-methyltransferase YrrM